MEKQNGKEELQSRREFFRNAAKAALPVLGAIVLSSTPLLSKAMEADPSGCKYMCSDGCYTACKGCSSTCTGQCFRGCLGSCTGSCSGSCQRSSH